MTPKTGVCSNSPREFRTSGASKGSDQGSSCCIWIISPRIASKSAGVANVMCIGLGIVQRRRRRNRRSANQPTTSLPTESSKKDGDLRHSDHQDVAQLCSGTIEIQGEAETPDKSTPHFSLHFGDAKIGSQGGDTVSTEAVASRRHAGGHPPVTGWKLELPTTTWHLL